MTAFRDRIKSLRRVRAGDLRPNQKNWRTHPKAQHEALQGVLADVGYADAVLAREFGDGSLMLIDGHLRAGVDPDAKIPVLILDVTEEEADKLLASIDPLAAMAGVDAARLGELLGTVKTDNSALQAMLAGLVPEGTGPNDGAVVQDEVPDPPKKPVECMARPMRNHGGAGDDVYEPFLGSGTTVIAAEQLGRRCCGMELSPAYLDVVIMRWEALTGRKAKRSK